MKANELDFLRDLSALLRKHDVEICANGGDDELCFDIGKNETYRRITFPFEYCEWDVEDMGSLTITADNVMDLAKTKD